MTTTLTPDLLAASAAADRSAPDDYELAGRVLSRGHPGIAEQVALRARADELEANHLRRLWLEQRRADR